MHKFLRKSAGDLAKCDGNFNQKRRGVKMGIRKRSKTFKNVQKLSENIQKLCRNIQKYSKILKVLAHLIEIFVNRGFHRLHGEIRHEKRQESGVRSQKTEDRSQESGVRI